jgi:hypothetical protein
MNVTRNRVVKPASRGLRSKRTLGVVAAGLALAVTGGVAYGTTVGFGTNLVGQEYAEGLQVSSNQIIKPSVSGS